MKILPEIKKALEPNDLRVLLDRAKSEITFLYNALDTIGSICPSRCPAYSSEEALKAWSSVDAVLDELSNGRYCDYERVV